MIQHPSDLRRTADHAGRDPANHAVRIIWLCAGIARELIRSRAFYRAAEVIATLAGFQPEQDWSRAYQAKVVAALEFELYDNKLVWLLAQRKEEQQGSSAA